MSRPDVGRPRTAANKWLRDVLPAYPQLAERPTPSTCPAIFATWEDLHELMTGWRHADPVRSFRAAITNITKRRGK